MTNFRDKNYQDIEERTFNFCIRVIKMVMQLPKNMVVYRIGGQLIDSASSADSNVIHARAALTKKEFIFHMNKAAMEAKESYRWIKILIAIGLMKEERIKDLLQENEEIISILVTITKNAQKN